MSSESVVDREGFGLTPTTPPFLTECGLFRLSLGFTAWVRERCIFEGYGSLQKCIAPQLTKTVRFQTSRPRETPTQIFMLCGVTIPLCSTAHQAIILVIASSMKSTSGRRVFHSALKLKGWPIVERVEVRMLAQVTARRVRSPPAERIRFPFQWLSGKG